MGRLILVLNVIFVFLRHCSLSVGSSECPNLVIQSPNYGNTYPPNLNCSWILTSNDSSTIIQFTAENIQLEECSRCSCDYLEVFDGSDGTKSLGRYCKGDIRLFSTGRHMLIVFRTDGRGGDKGFTASYKNVPKMDVCSRTESFVTVRYQAYGNIMCEWLINNTAPGHSRVALEISKLSFESACSGCDCGSVEVYDGKSSSDAKLGTWCTRPEVPKYLISDGSYLFIKFMTGPHVSGHNFKANYEELEENRVCSNTPASQNSNGALKSYDYKSKYISKTNTLFCSWQLRVDDGYVIRIIVKTLDFGGCETCGSLQIFDASKVSSTKLGEWTKEKPDLVSSSNHMFVTFNTNQFAETDGLEITYEPIRDTNVCPKPAENKGEIKTYAYPLNYPGNIQCTWALNAPVNHVIRLTIDTFSFPSCKTPELSKDYIGVYDGDTKFAKKIVENLSECSLTKNVDLVSSSNQLLVEFTSKSWKGSKGFNGKYESISKDKVCDGSGILRASTILEKSIASAIYPKHYLGNMKCSWLIQTEPGSVIRFSVQNIEFQDCKNCACDYIEIYDGTTDQSKSSGRWCKNTAELLSSGQNMYIVMKTDTFMAYKGFKATYKAIPESRVCPGSGKRAAASGSIQSPYFPDHYWGGLFCEWTISANPGHKVHLTAATFNLQDCSRCGCDKITIYDGNSSISRALGDWCISSFNVISRERNLHIAFTSNFDFIGGGFQARYVSIRDEEECPLIISKDGTNGNVRTMNYPNPSPGNMDCTRKISGQSDDVIRLEFNPDSQIGYKDVLQLYDSGPSSEWLPFQRWSSNDLPDFIFTSGPRLLVKFQTDTKSNAKGFKALFRFIKKNAGCDGTGTLTESTGNMKSPKYQYGKHQIFFCQWLISAPVKFNIRLSLTYKTNSVISNPTCSKHFVEVFNGSHPTNTSIGRFCETVISQTIIINSSSTYVMLWVDSNLNANEGPFFSADYKFILKPNQGAGEDMKSESSLDVGAIIGITLGSFFALLAVTGLAFYFRSDIQKLVRLMGYCF